MSRALLITGSPGAGKSTLLDRLSTLLEQCGVPFAAIEADELSRGWPYPAFADWRRRLELVCADLRASQPGNLIVVATVESDFELDATVKAVGTDEVTVLCLSAPAGIAQARVAAREPEDWPGRAGLIEHAAVLADRLPRLRGIDRVMATASAEPAQLARDVAAWWGAHGPSQ